MYSPPTKIALDLWSFFFYSSPMRPSALGAEELWLLCSLLYLHRQAHSILSRSLLNDCTIHFFILLLPLPQFLPLFNIYPVIAAVFLKPPQLLSCTRWGTNIHMRKRRQNNKESMGASVTRAAYVTWLCWPFSLPPRGSPSGYRRRRQWFWSSALSLGGPPTRLLPEIMLPPDPAERLPSNTHRTPHL